MINNSKHFRLIFLFTIIIFPRICIAGPAPKFAGYWQPENLNSNIICINIIQKESLYICEHYMKTGEVIKQVNLTLNSQGDILSTEYGTYKYVNGNDILLNVFFQTPPLFKRISIEKFNILISPFMKAQKDKAALQNTYVSDPNDPFIGIFSENSPATMFLIIEGKGANEYMLRWRNNNNSRNLIGHKKGNVLYYPVLDMQIGITQADNVVRDNKQYSQCLKENSGWTRYCKLSFDEIPENIKKEFPRLVPTSSNSSQSISQTKLSDLKHEKVFDCTAFISADKMNVFYIGVDNPVTIDVPGISNDKLKISITGSGFNLIKNDQKGNGYYTANVTSVGECGITVEAYIDGKLIHLRTAKYRVKRVPDPISTLNNNMGGPINKEVFSNQIKIIPQMADFEFESFFIITEFKMRIVRSDNSQAEFNVTGNELSPEMSMQISKAMTGDLIVFYDIKANQIQSLEEDTRKLTSMVFTIK